MLPLTIGCWPMAQFDVVVVGLGATGAAALHRLARRGVRALAIERLIPGHDQPHQVMDAAETMRRFPAFKIPEDYVGVFQPDGGFIAAEAAIAAMLAQA